MTNPKVLNFATPNSVFQKREGKYMKIKFKNLVITVHIPTITCGLYSQIPAPHTNLCVCHKNPFHCARILAQFSTIPCNCPCGLALISSIPCAGVCWHIPLWVGKGLPAHSHMVCPLLHMSLSMFFV